MRYTCTWSLFTPNFRPVTMSSPEICNNSQVITYMRYTCTWSLSTPNFRPVTMSSPEICNNPQVITYMRYTCTWSLFTPNFKPVTMSSPKISNGLRQNLRDQDFCADSQDFRSFSVGSIQVLYISSVRRRRGLGKSLRIKS
jgi:hypothetical protein